MRIVAAGDSVMWGQGLLPGKKFAHSFAAFIDGAPGVDVESVEMLAHSGAVIVADPPIAPVDLAAARIDGAPMADERRAIAEGEIPWPTPTVPEQLGRIPSPETVDILLLTGGANDFGFFENLIQIQRQLKTLESQIEPAFSRVPDLIAEARRLCPNAVIVYTGYYAGLSSASWATDSQARNIIDDLVDIYDRGMPAAESARVDDDAMRRLILNCVYFFHSGLKWIRTAVAAAMESPGPAVIFAHPRFGRDNALLGPTPWIQSPVDRTIPRLGIDDQYDVREDACPLVHTGNDLGVSQAREMCVRAATFHPNAVGAEAYMKAVAHAWDRDRAVGVNELVDLSPGTRSARHAIARFSLHRDGKGRPRPALRLRSLSQHLVVDTIRVTIGTGTGGLFPGTLDRMWLEIGIAGEHHPLRWLLHRRTGRSTATNKVPEFFKGGEEYTFFVDPCFDSGGDRVAPGPLLLKGIAYVGLCKESTTLDEYLEGLPTEIIAEIIGEIAEASGLQTTNADWTAIDRDGLIWRTLRESFKEISKVLKLRTVQLLINESVEIYKADLDRTLEDSAAWRSGERGSAPYPAG
jgi:hypothetical protein